MANDEIGGKDLTGVTPSGAAHGEAPAGTAVVARDSFENPGFPPHRPRVSARA